MKCPFHGAIIPRDDVGRPLSLRSEDDTPTTSSKEAELWQDIQQDIERATGVTLGVSQKGKGKMKRKRKGLVESHMIIAVKSHDHSY